MPQLMTVKVCNDSVMH